MSGKYFSVKCSETEGWRATVKVDEDGDIYIGAGTAEDDRVLLSRADAKALAKFLLAEVEHQEQNRLKVLEALVEPARALYTEYSIAIPKGKWNEPIREAAAAAIKEANK